MTTKVYDVSVRLDLHKVNCPGVWLCPKGKVSIKVCLFGVSDFTKQVDPSFPLIFNERFHFQRKFRKSNTLLELHEELGASLLTMQLYQFPTETTQSVKLAVFNSTLVHVLSSDNDISRYKPSEVDLLFYPCKIFPGIIAPKAEIVAKLAVVENVEQAKMKVNTTVSSQPSEKRLADDQKIIRQQPVCHTKNYFRCKCFKDWCNSDSQRFKLSSKGHREMRPRSARRTTRPTKQNKRRFKSCSSAYGETSTSESEEDPILRSKAEGGGEKCISNVIGARCRCACARQNEDTKTKVTASQPHVSEYSSSDYTDSTPDEPALARRAQSPTGCQCFKKTWRARFEEEMVKRKRGEGLKPGSDEAYNPDRYRPREENRRARESTWPDSHRRERHDARPIDSEMMRRARPNDENRRKASLVLEKTTVDGRKWGVKAFPYPQSTSVR